MILFPATLQVNSQDDAFIAAKRLEGRSDGTLNYYQFTVEKMFEDIGKNFRAITTDDLRDYLSRYYTEKEVSKVRVMLRVRIRNILDRNTISVKLHNVA